VCGEALGTQEVRGYPFSQVVILKKGTFDFAEFSKFGRSHWVDAMGGVGGDGDGIAAGGPIPLGGLACAAGVPVCAGGDVDGDDGGVGGETAGV
jgi:hypothetical protein